MHEQNTEELDEITCQVPTEVYDNHLSHPPSNKKKTIYEH